MTLSSLILPFIDKSQRIRIESLLKSKKGRVKLQSSLSHKITLNEKLSRKLTSDEQNFKTILMLLSSGNKNGRFHILSEDIHIDGLELPLPEALSKTYSSGNSFFLISENGKTGYYESEGKNNRYILIKNN